jgi:hypothetical protein
MNYTMEVDINAPLAAVIAVADQPAEWTNWLEDLKAFEHLSGTNGKVGARYGLVFKTGQREMAFTAEIIQNDLPEIMRTTMDACNLVATSTTRIRAIDDQRTRFISEQDFAFKGVFNQLVGFVLQREFKAQTRRHLANFKSLVESRLG